MRLDCLARCTPGVPPGAPRLEPMTGGATITGPRLEGPRLEPRPEPAKVFGEEEHTKRFRTVIYRIVL